MKRKTFYVSPLGNDRWSGLLADPNEERTDGPFATLFKARDAIRQLKGRAPGSRVFIRGGVYPLVEPLVLGPEDSGTKACPITYTAYQDEVPLLDGGRGITGWKLLDDAKDTVSDAQGKVWVARIPRGWQFKQLFSNGRLLPRSASEDDDDWHTWKTARLGKSQRTLIVPPADLKGVGDCRNAEVSCLTTPYTYWANALAPVTRIDAKRGSIGFAAMWVHRPEVLKAIPYRLENLLSGIRREGQWFVDSRAGKVYLWPLGNEDPNGINVTAPYLCEAIQFQGNLGKAQWVQHITLRGISVVHTNLSPHIADASHSAFDARDAAINLSGVEDCKIEKCRIFNVGGGAITAGLHAKRIVVRGCEIRDCGGFGIHFSGSLKVPEASCGHNRISDNHLHHCGRLYWHSSGIGLSTSERSVVCNNHIHDMPYVGIGTGGARHLQFVNWPRPSKELEGIWKRFGDGGPPTVAGIKKLIPGHNRIERNLIHDVMAVLDDGAAVYCHAGHHNKVRHNLVYRAHGNGSHGLYFDDEEMDSLMEFNVVYDCPVNIYAERGSGLHLHNNAKNTVRNNIFVGGNRLFTFPNSYGGHRIERNVFVFGDGHAIPRTPEPIHGPGDGRRQPDWDAGPSVMDHNLFWSRVGAEPAKDFLAWWREQGFGQHSVVADPLFSDPKNGNYQLKKRSPAFRLGVNPFSLEGIGPRR